MLRALHLIGLGFVLFVVMLNGGLILGAAIFIADWLLWRKWKPKPKPK
jgi:hypothetical protein